MTPEQKARVWEAINAYTKAVADVWSLRSVVGCDNDDILEIKALAAAVNAEIVRIEQDAIDKRATQV